MLANGRRGYPSRRATAPRILFIVVPIVELYVIIQVGQEIGVAWTIAILIGDALLGTSSCASRAARPGGASTRPSTSAASPAARLPTGS